MNARRGDGGEGRMIEGERGDGEGERIMEGEEVKGG